MKLTRDNVTIVEEDRYFRVKILLIDGPTHYLHSEKVNLETAIRMRDELIA